jgi:multidrug transporter EmrE-like cation transporter
MIAVALLLATVVLTVFGQLVFKWRIDEAGTFPSDTGERVRFLAELALDPWVIGVFVSALIASVTYGVALRRLELSVAYPVMSLSFVFVLVFSVLLFSESLTAGKVIGVALICAGVIVSSWT